MKLERTDNYGLIHRIATDPDVWPMIVDDFTPEPREWRPPAGRDVIWLLASEDDEILGLFCLMAENSICWQAHILMMPHARGKIALDACRGLYDWVWKNTAVMRLTGSIPEYNLPAILIAAESGMSRYGVNPRSFLKDGRLYDQILLGLSRPELSGIGAA